MSEAIYTLFEGGYHYGVAILTNSLCENGYRGAIYAGHRGALPAWAESAARRAVGKWEDARVLDVADGLQLVFLQLTTDYHLTNYKPDFALELLAGPCRDAEALYYFDPDICVTERWSFFEEWVGCGLALCEDINSPLPENHPRRVGWRRYFAAWGFNLKFRSCEYVNGGFVGVSRQDFGLFDAWKNLQLRMAEEIGGLSASKLVNGEAYTSKGFANCFDASDQDALNAAVEAFDGDVAVIGQEAMAFKHGAVVMPHALGNGKPWQRSYVKEVLLQGRPPRLADKSYWRYTDGPLRCYSDAHKFIKRTDLQIASAIGRIYRRG